MMLISFSLLMIGQILLQDFPNSSLSWRGYDSAEAHLLLLNLLVYAYTGADAHGMHVAGFLQ